MTFRQFTLKNIRGKWHQYTAYFFSSMFTVMIFFIYAAFIFHPQVMEGEMHQGIRSLMVACEFIIIVFSFFFVMYSSSAFLKSRKQEFGLLTLLGMTRAQLSRMVLYEHSLIALLSTAGGIVLGIGFSKLFFVMIGALLDLEQPLPFMVSGQSVWITFVSFFAVFEVITLFSLFGIGRSRIIDLIKAAKQPKSLPIFSKWLVIVSIVCLALGYVIAWFSGVAIIFTMFPILFFTILGTYFMFTQASVAVLRGMQRNRGILYKNTNLLTISQLVYKMKDNARVLFVVAILSAVVLTASGTLYTFYQGITDQVTDMTPHTFSFTEQGVDQHDVIEPEVVESILNQHGERIRYSSRVIGIAGEVTDKNEQVPVGDTVNIISNHDYNELTKKMNDAEPLQIEPDHTIIVNPFTMDRGSDALPEKMEVQIGNEDVTLHPDHLQTEAVLNHDSRVSTVLVLNDEKFAQLAGHIPNDDKIVFYSYELENWTKSLAAVSDIQAKIPKEYEPYFNSRVEPYVQTKQIFSLTLFIGVFVSMLFFIAAGSMLYFKLFTEIQEDRAQFKTLQRIGMTVQEMKKIATTQIGLIFFLPFCVGVVHAGFALKTLGDVLMVSVWKYALVVIGIYFVMQLFYFLLSRHTYLKQLNRSL